MGFLKFLASKRHIIFVIVFFIALWVYTIFSLIGAIDTAKIHAVLSVPISEAPFGWVAFLVCFAAWLVRK